MCYKYVIIALRLRYDCIKNVLKIHYEWIKKTIVNKGLMITYGVNKGLIINYRVSKELLINKS